MIRMLPLLMHPEDRRDLHDDCSMTGNKDFRAIDVMDLDGCDEKRKETGGYCK